ncbi:hypothetical protein CMV_022650 [Castanea mollissima]|uniref:Uncharacterized protein n=1 Tax=Castanea mollissima TaxID=60419 RepID=A0A8J4QHL4_9ROSI|nr:hypothetical protein CMV_022650 [Castanea mollissima]
MERASYFEAASKSDVNWKSKAKLDFYGVICTLLTLYSRPFSSLFFIPNSNNFSLCSALPFEFKKQKIVGERPIKYKK